MIDNVNALSELQEPVRSIIAKVELFNGSTLLATFAHDGALQSFEIERTGEGHFFGFGYCQRLNVKLIDLGRDIEPAAGGVLRVSYKVGNSWLTPYPDFTITEVRRDENTNGLSVFAYDAVRAAEFATVADVAAEAPYKISAFAEDCAAFLGLGIDIDELAETPFAYEYEEGANFDGAEKLRDVLDDIAEATQTIYYVAGNGENAVLRFKRLAPEAEEVLEIYREDYFSASTKSNRRLSRIMHVTELGDNVEAHTTETGSTAYVRDNAFYELQPDIADYLTQAIIEVGGLTLLQYEMDWRGNYLIEMGDCFTLEDKDGNYVPAYFLSDKATYNGGLRQVTSYQYTADDETEANPATLGAALTQTYARVDKANKQITLVASEQGRQRESISSLQLNTGAINASVEDIRSSVNATAEQQAADIAELRSSVNTKITAQDVSVIVAQEIAGGVSGVRTETGFTFDADGLTVSKTDSAITTQITEDGMSISRSGSEVLRADNGGVKAEDLHATTYLIIGANSRFEDYTNAGEQRTGCFWIGN